MGYYKMTVRDHKGEIVRGLIDKGFDAMGNEVTIWDNQPMAPVEDSYSVEVSLGNGRTTVYGNFTLDVARTMFINLTTVKPLTGN